MYHSERPTGRLFTSREELQASGPGWRDHPDLVNTPEPDAAPIVAAPVALRDPELEDDPEHASDDVPVQGEPDAEVVPEETPSPVVMVHAATPPPDPLLASRRPDLKKSHKKKPTT